MIATILATALLAGPKVNLITLRWIPTTPNGRITWNHISNSGKLTPFKSLIIEGQRARSWGLFVASDDGSKLVFSTVHGGRDAACVVWQSGRREWIDGRYYGEWSPGGRYLALATFGGRSSDLQVYDGETLRPLATLHSNGAAWSGTSTLTYWNWGNSTRMVDPKLAQWEPDNGAASVQTKIGSAIKSFYARCAADGKTAGQDFTGMPKASDAPAPYYPLGFVISKDFDSAFCWDSREVYEPHPLFDSGHGIIWGTLCSPSVERSWSSIICMRRMPCVSPGMGRAFTTCHLAGQSSRVG